jgi:hypothetical protein
VEGGFHLVILCLESLSPMGPKLGLLYFNRLLTYIVHTCNAILDCRREKKERESKGRRNNRKISRAYVPPVKLYQYL